MRAFPTTWACTARQITPPGATLYPGSYTIRAASNEAGQRGKFKLTVSGSISKTPDLPVEPAPVTCQASLNQRNLVAGQAHAGRWGPDCESNTYNYPAQYARYYFTVNERKQVTVTLTDTDDPKAVRGSPARVHRGERGDRHPVRQHPGSWAR